MKQRIALTMAVAGAAAAATVAAAGGSGARAQDAGPRTLALVAHEQRCASADNGRRGDSLGDLNACRGTLRDARTGATAGSARWVCVFLGSERAGDDCSAVVTLRRGTLQAAGTLSHTRPRSEWAITGGTGEHAGAGGSVVLQQRSATRTAATITLVP